MDPLKEVIVVKDGDTCPECGGVIRKKRPIFPWLTEHHACEDCHAEWNEDGH